VTATTTQFLRGAEIGLKHILVYPRPSYSPHHNIKTDKGKRNISTIIGKRILRKVFQL
jgi:hypothetical protein